MRLRATKVGAPVAARPLARPGLDLEGEVVAVDSRIDADTRTLRVRASLDNAEDALRAGMAFSIGMRFPGDVFAAVDPLAIQWNAGGAYVWVGEDGAAKQVPVRIVQRNNDAVLVDAEACAKVPAGARHGVDHLGAQFGGKLRQVAVVHGLQVRRDADLVEQGCGWRLCHSQASLSRRPWLPREGMVRACGIYTALVCHMQNAARDFNRFSKSRAYFAGLIPCNPTQPRLLQGNSGILRTPPIASCGGGYFFFLARAA